MLLGEFPNRNQHLTEILLGSPSLIHPMLVDFALLAARLGEASHHARISGLHPAKVVKKLVETEVVAEDGIEPPTQGFSVLCSTN